MPGYIVWILASILAVLLSMNFPGLWIYTLFILIATLIVCFFEILKSVFVYLGQFKCRSNTDDIKEKMKNEQYINEINKEGSSFFDVLRTWWKARM